MSIKSFYQVDSNMPMYMPKIYNCLTSRQVLKRVVDHFKSKKIEFTNLSAYKTEDVFLYDIFHSNDTMIEIVDTIVQKVNDNVSTEVLELTTVNKNSLALQLSESIISWMVKNGLPISFECVCDFESTTTYKPDGEDRIKEKLKNYLNYLESVSQALDVKDYLISEEHDLYNRGYFAGLKQSKENISNILKDEPWNDKEL